MKKYSFLLIMILIIQDINAQTIDSAKKNNWTIHFQLTVVNQIHSGFKAAYSGQNSLADTVEPWATSITSTLFLGRKLWKGAAVYFNPELSGGQGLSYATGVAGALNGETYRIGSTTPEVTGARAYFQQCIPFRKTGYENIEDGVNQVADLTPTNMIKITAGKFSITDFYDKNNYSHDPRSQFLNWSLMSNGAWDYPANTKGYTIGIVTELITPSWSIRLSSVAVPKIANHSEMEYVMGKAQSETIEFEKKLILNKRPGTIRLLGTYTTSRAPSYQEGLNAIKSSDTNLLLVISGNAMNNNFGGEKKGICLNVEQELSNSVGAFLRTGWNDGKYATWAFTEIDQSISAGLSFKGNQWKRADDVFGIATAINGISKDHRDFLKAGGYGFIIGDSRLNYGHEAIIETFYNARMTKNIWLTLDYQFVNNPAYNKDRGPVNVFGIRAHVEI